MNLPDGRVASYKYDPFGRRVSKTVDGVVTYFLYADEGLVAEYNQSGGLIKGYGWKPGGTWGTDPVAMVENGATYFYHNDHLGTPQKLTDATGTVVWSAQYTVFGAAHVDAASTIENNLKFPGQYFDAETGLHYNYHRYYDPQTGRYITADPIGLDEALNLYPYVDNDPIIQLDNLGLCPSEIVTDWMWIHPKMKDRENFFALANLIKKEGDCAKCEVVICTYKVRYFFRYKQKKSKKWNYSGSKRQYEISLKWDCKSGGFDGEVFSSRRTQ